MYSSLLLGIAAFHCFTVSRSLWGMHGFRKPCARGCPKEDSEPAEAGQLSLASNNFRVVCTDSSSLVCRVLPHRAATAAPACHFGTAASVPTRITSPLRGGACDLEALPPAFLKAIACSLQVSVRTFDQLSQRSQRAMPSTVCIWGSGISAWSTVHLANFLEILN